MPVAQAVRELAGFDPEALRQFLDRRQPRLASPSLDPPDAGQVDPGGVGQTVLREAFPGAQLTDPLTEGFAGAVGIIIDRNGHRESVAATDRLDQSVMAVYYFASPKAGRAPTRSVALFDRSRPLRSTRPSRCSVGSSPSRVEYGWIDDNPAVGCRRRIKIERSPAPHLESAGQIAAVLDAAAELDADPGWLIDDRLPVIATLVFSGLRVHELAALHWGDLDFATSTIHVRHSKTPAGIREVMMCPALRGNLILYRARRGRPGSRELVFRTTRGGPRTKDNVRLRILLPVLVRAEELLEARGLSSLPPGSPRTRSATPSLPSFSQSARTPSR